MKLMNILFFAPTLFTIWVVPNIQYTVCIGENTQCTYSSVSILSCCGDTYKINLIEKNITSSTSTVCTLSTAHVYVTLYN